MYHAFSMMIVASAFVLLHGCVPETLDDFAVGQVVEGDAKGGPNMTEPDVNGVKCLTNNDCPIHPNPCKRFACASGSCVAEVAAAILDQTCDDKNACTSATKCTQDGQCLGTTKDCNDGEGCTVDSCDTSTGNCKYDALSEGDPCTPEPAKCFGGDDGTCTGGKCLLGANPSVICPCHPSWKSSDDPALSKIGCPEWHDADDKCAGKNYCKATAAGGFQCAANPATVVTCSDKKDTDCNKNTCDTDSGNCVMTPAKDGDPCSDGDDKCTKTDRCNAGVCESGAMLCKCTPNNVKGCQTDTNWSPCNGVYYCDTEPALNKCALANPVTCSPLKDTSCLKNFCMPNVGNCQLVPIENIMWKKDSKTWMLRAAPTTLFIGCNDGNKCTANDQCGEGECKSGPALQCSCETDADCTANDDGNLCNGSLYCDMNEGECLLNPVSVIKCASVNDTQCLKNLCYPAIGQCKLTPIENVKTEASEQKNKNGNKVIVTKVVIYPYKAVAFVPCDDGNACTVNDQCTVGSCKSGETNICNCQKDADCAKQDDGDLCNGTLYCDIASGKCKPNPATVVHCSTVDDTYCARTTCDPKTGQCKLESIKYDVLVTDCKDACNGAKSCESYCMTKHNKCGPGKDNLCCDDGDPCTVNDHCDKGSCATGKTTICTCSTDADCTSKYDGNPCTGTMYCDKKSSTCKVNPASVVHCSAGLNSQCAVNVCDSGDGNCKLTPRTHLEETMGDVKVKVGGVMQTQKVKKLIIHKEPFKKYVLCDDGNPCTSSDECDGLQCSAGTAICACTTSSDCAYLADDKNNCEGTYFCDMSGASPTCKVNPKSVVVCSSLKDTACTRYLCDPADGLCKDKPVLDDVYSCDDGNPCTQSDSCVGGKCTSGTNTCSCAADSDCDALTAGNKCVSFVCENKTTCKINPKALMTCSSAADQGCTKNTCNPKTGQCEMVDDGSCDDSNPCTIDACDTNAGKCTSIAATDGTPAGSKKAGGKTVVQFCDGGKAIDAPDGMTMVPAGVFFMGCNLKAEACDSPSAATETLHKVDLSAFWIDSFEVTVAKYEVCVKDGTCTKPATDSSCTGSNYGDPTRVQHPVNCVTVDQAKGFCGFFDAKATLPTEAQWEKAGRGGCLTGQSELMCQDAAPSYPWGNKPSADCTQAIMKHLDTGQDGCGAGHTAQIASRSSTDVSTYQVFDMAGNVSELVADLYDKDFYTKPSTKDPINTGGGGKNVVRGGHWKATAVQMGLARRGQDGGASATVGFRCVKLVK